jgi:[ribosomal protein S5]-alanine N-acetyltransferase
VQRQRILQTDRLEVTSWLSSDIDDLFVVHSDAETMRYVRQGRPETRAETVALIDRYIAEHATMGFTTWRIVDLDNHLVGRAGFRPRQDGRELGYTVRRDLWGQGLATEVGAALVGWHLTHAAGCPLYAYVAVENPASRRVLEKIGFTVIGREDHSGMHCYLLRYGLDADRQPAEQRGASGRSVD